MSGLEFVSTGTAGSAGSGSSVSLADVAVGSWNNSSNIQAQIGPGHTTVTFIMAAGDSYTLGFPVGVTVFSIVERAFAVVDGVLVAGAENVRGDQGSIISGHEVVPVDTSVVNVVEVNFLAPS